MTVQLRGRVLALPHLNRSLGSSPSSRKKIKRREKQRRDVEQIFNARFRKYILNFYRQDCTNKGYAHALNNKQNTADNLNNS